MGIKLIDTWYIYKYISFGFVSLLHVSSASSTCTNPKGSEQLKQHPGSSSNLLLDAQSVTISSVTGKIVEEYLSPDRPCGLVNNPTTYSWGPSINQPAGRSLSFFSRKTGLRHYHILVIRTANSCEGSKNFPCLLANKLACHSSMDIGRKTNLLAPRQKQFITHNKNSSQSNTTCSHFPQYDTEEPDDAWMRQERYPCLGNSNLL